ncbi:MAG: preprotein translocase subunit SecA [Patescibacteria group bacterium]|jgi:preprotein translocase subunit SecA
MGLFSKFFNFNERELNRYRTILVEINALEEKAKKLKDADFPKETARLKEEMGGRKEKLDSILPWAFALVREAAVRVLGERHFDVQLIAGIALHEGRIAEQKTGEGKTLSATAPLYLNALVGRGVHLVTVNDYLARLHAGWMGRVFDFLGITTSAMISEQSFVYDKTYLDEKASDWRMRHLKPTDRRSAYQADVTYGINSEFGFDFLRDNMSFSLPEKVQRDFYFAVVDEVDSVLIDEARTPHIISSPFDDDVSRYYQYAKMVDRLMSGTDYVIDEKMRTANLTEHGIEKIEKMLGVTNVYEKDYDSLYHLEASLKAKSLFKLNKDYIVRNGEVIIVDEFTGRLLEGRRFSEGLHQAIEAKENVAIKKESKTLATISLQNYFRKYDKLAGMTGTAVTEAEEFHKIYKLDVIVIPTNRKLVRKDHPDFIYKTERGKFTALVDIIAEEHAKGRPILVGTTSIDKNEALSSLLRKKGIKHELLNAKNHEREAQIISDAGKKGAVTIATNMAGRGVDIILGGNAPNRVRSQESGVKSADKEYEKAYKEWQKGHDEVVQLGGLFVMGTERHESRRIDNQLRGRAGRQGDPGETRFFVALEDDMLRIFGGDQIGKLMTFFNFPENQPIEHSMVSRAMEQAQVKVEGFNFDSRKHLLEYDDVLNKQRDIIYSQRDKIMDYVAAPTTQFSEFMQTQVQKFVEDFSIPFTMGKKDEKEAVVKLLEGFFAIDEEGRKALLEMEPREFTERFEQNIITALARKEKGFGPELFKEAVRTLFLSTIDYYFTEHLTSIEDLREGINLRGYAQLDPLVEYKKESYKFFNTMLQNIRTDFFRRLLHLEIDSQQTQNSNLQISNQAQKSKNKKNKINQNDTQTVRQSDTQTSTNKLSRNDPCWCGSGKKWKKCHYPKLS